MFLPIFDVSINYDNSLRSVIVFFLLLQWQRNLVPWIFTWHFLFHWPSCCRSESQCRWNACQFLIMYLATWSQLKMDLYQIYIGYLTSIFFFFSLLLALEARWCISFLEITSTQSQYKVFKSWVCLLLQCLFSIYTLWNDWRKGGRGAAGDEMVR